MTDALRPGQVWRDARGRPIHVHGGGVLHVDGRFYWYGENKEHTVPGRGVWHWGVRCYSSTDLVSWRDEGVIIPPELDDPTSPLHPAQVLDRPHLVVDPRGRIVCWVRHSDRSGRPQRLVVLVAETVLGPYTMVQPGLRPLGMDAGDFDLVVDPDDGKGYLYFERVGKELICADLTEPLTDVTGYYTTHMPRPGPPFVREAPAYFTRRGVHYLITSGTTWYFPNRSEVASAPTYHGPWTGLGDAHPEDPSGTSFRSQVSAVFRHPHKRDLHIALADRWLPDLALDAPDATDALACGDDKGMALLRAHGYGGDPDLSRARHVWLPVAFDDAGRPRIDWRDEWRIDDYD